MTTTAHIDCSKLNQGNIGDPQDNHRYIKYAADFDINPLSFDFPSGASPLLTFGVPKFIFIDNQNNLYDMNVMVSSTNQSFPVPAESAGYYYIDAVAGSSIVVTPASDPSGVVTFVFYNFDRAPIVWYKTNVTTSAVTIANGADVALGATTDAAITNPASVGTAMSFLKGMVSLFATAIGFTPRYTATGVVAVTGAAVSNTPSAATGNLVAGRQGYLALRGTGSATFTLLFSTDGVNYEPETSAVNGSGPIINYQVAYNGGVNNGIKIPFGVGCYGTTVKVLPGVVTGVINYDIEQN